MILTEIVKGLTRKIEELSVALGRVYRACEDCDCRPDGCGCPVQEVIDRMEDLDI